MGVPGPQPSVTGFSITYQQFVIIGHVGKLPYSSHRSQLIHFPSAGSSGYIHGRFLFPGILGDDIDHTAFGATSIQRAGTAAQHFDTFDIIHIIQQRRIHIP